MQRPSASVTAGGNGPAVQIVASLDGAGITRFQQHPQRPARQPAYAFARCNLAQSPGSSGPGYCACRAAIALIHLNARFRCGALLTMVMGNQGARVTGSASFLVSAPDGPCRHYAATEIARANVRMARVQGPERQAIAGF